MLLKTTTAILFLAAMAALTPLASAGRDKNPDPYNQCGAPFCGSPGNAAAAGAVVRTGAVGGKVKVDGEPPKE